MHCKYDKAFKPLRIVHPTNGWRHCREQFIGWPPLNFNNRRTVADHNKKSVLASNFTGINDNIGDFQVVWNEKKITLTGIAQVRL